MSIEIPITTKELRAIGRVLREEKEVICLDSRAYVTTLLVAQRRAMLGQEVRAKIILKERGRVPSTPEGSTDASEI